MQSLDKHRGTVTIKFRNEAYRARGVYEMFDSGIRASSIGNKQYVVTPEHLALFDRKDIKYDIIE